MVYNCLGTFLSFELVKCMNTVHSSFSHAWSAPCKQKKSYNRVIFLPFWHIIVPYFHVFWMGFYVTKQQIRVWLCWKSKVCLKTLVNKRLQISRNTAGIRDGAIEQKRKLLLKLNIFCSVKPGGGRIMLCPAGTKKLGRVDGKMLWIHFQGKQEENLLEVSELHWGGFDKSTLLL